MCRHGLNQNVNKESLLAVYISKGINKKVNYYSFPIIKKEKWLKGAKTKYDIPQYIEGIPEGFAIFCTTKEAGKVRKYQERIERKNKLKEKEKKEATKNINNNDINREVEDMDVINKRLIVGAINNNINEKVTKNHKENTEEEKESDDNDSNNSIIDEIQEPLPRADHKYCYICKTKFEKYLKHIKSDTHFDNLYRHKNLFVKIRKSFEKIINFWEINGRNKKLNNLGKNQNVLFSNSKTEETSIKDKITQNKKFNIINLFDNKKKRNINNKKNRRSYKINNSIKNIDLNHNLNYNKMGKYFQNKKEVHPTFNKIILNKNENNEHIINLTINNNINKNIFINNSINEQMIKNELDLNYQINTINYININKNDNNTDNKTFNDNQIQISKEEKIQPKFVTKHYPKFPALVLNSIPKSRKRKKNEIIKNSEIFVINPKKIDFDYFPVLNVENSGKLINKTLLSFK